MAPTHSTSFVFWVPGLNSTVSHPLFWHYTCEKQACFDFCWFSLLQDSPTAACRGRPARMLRKRLDKQKLRVGEGSASPQRADYSSDTGSQNSVSIKVPSGKWWIAMSSVASYCSGFSIRYRSNLALTLEVSTPITLDPVLSLNVIWRTQCSYDQCQVLRTRQ